jgi:hypothetical protein
VSWYSLTATGRKKLKLHLKGLENLLKAAGEEG